jgi:hypothetical protein
MQKLCATSQGTTMARNEANTKQQLINPRLQQDGWQLETTAGRLNSQVHTECIGQQLLAQILNDKIDKETNNPTAKPTSSRGRKPKL